VSEQVEVWWDVVDLSFHVIETPLQGTHMARAWQHPDNELGS
jgi:hypothetical protein